MLPEMDYAIAFGPQHTVITKFQRARHMGKAGYRIIKIISNAGCCLLVLKLIDKIIYNFPEMCLCPYRQYDIIFHTLFLPPQ